MSGGLITFDASEPSTAQTAKTRRIAQRWLAQGGLCALCGKPIRPVGRITSGGAPSLDHVFPRCRESIKPGTPMPIGLATHRRLVVGQTVVAHRKCNSAKGHRAPHGCEIIWLIAVNARLGTDLPSVRWKSRRAAA